MRFSMLRLLGGAVIAVWLLTGCASGYLLDNTVQSFSQLTALPPQPTYRFERLPSQQDPWHQQLEAMADVALRNAGLQRDDSNARYSVQVGAQLQQVLSPWARPWYGWGSFGVSHHGVGLGFGFPLGYGYVEPPWFQREVSIIMRELSSNRAVYETRAFNVGPWTDDRSVLPVMFQAALQGFPSPPPGPRRVDIHVER